VTGRWAGFIDFHTALIYTLPYYPCITASREVTVLDLSDDTLKAMIRDYNGFDLSDEELALVRPELDFYVGELKKLEDLDLSDVFSGRLLQADEGGESHGQR